MISYSRDPKQEIPASAVKIIGLGGAGANMLERIALDSIEGAQLLAVNTDIRTLGASLAKEKIQLGINLTKGLGTGGDPELGSKAVLEAEDQIREALKGQKIVFICTGLGGGTGSGASPIVARIAREEGAFVVVFATMPFFFEGNRRREQAETSLNQLAVLSNALVTFDNNRMGELVLAKQGIHEAFGEADKMISESIKAVIRLVVRPGLINVGLDELMTALRTTRSRCLFGSGIAEGKDRASKALRNALSSPLLDQGNLLKDAQSVLVHLSGGESLTLFEIELLMQNLQKHVPDTAQVLFGAAIDPSMGDSLSITLISALPEDALAVATKPPEILATEKVEPKVIEEVTTKKEESTPEIIPDPQPITKKETEVKIDVEPVESNQSKTQDEIRPFAEPEPAVKQPAYKPLSSKDIEESIALTLEQIQRASAKSEEKPKEIPPETEPVKAIEEKPVEIEKVAASSEPVELAKEEFKSNQTPVIDEEIRGSIPKPQPSISPQLKIDPKHPGPQSEMSFEKAPRGRFEGDRPDVFDGEDLDLPPFLRKKKP